MGNGARHRYRLALTAGREDSLWYPQMRLFYRHQDEEWTAVIARIACALEMWVKQQ